MHIRLPTLADTERLAARVAARADVGDFIGLSGPLGAGKTTFARAFLAALAERAGVPPPAEVPSPTFTLVQTYALGALEVSHFDLYRIRDAAEAGELGVDEAATDGIVLVEWPERLGGDLPADRLDVALAMAVDDERRATLTPHGAWCERTTGLAP